MAVKELFNQTLKTTIADSDRIAVGIPSQNGCDNILFSYVKDQIDSEIANKIAGTITQPTITDNGTGEISISSFTASLFDNTTNSGSATIYTLAALNSQQLVENTYYYITANYNGGNPVTQLITNNTLITHSDIVNVSQVVWLKYGSIDQIVKFSTGNYGLGLPNKIGHRLIHTERFGYESGLSTTIDPTLHIIMDSGRMFYDGEFISVDSVDTNSVTYIEFFKSGGNLTAQTANVLENTKYCNGTNLVTANKYVVRWLYRSLAGDSIIYVLYGESDYTIKEAQESSEPSYKPDIITKMAVLVSRVIISSGSTTVSNQNFYLTKAPTGANVISHNDTIDKQGGTTNQYYHLTQTDETSSVTSPVDSDNLLIKENSSGIWKKITWANSKAAIKSYLNVLTKQIHTAGATLTINYTVDEVIINPATTLASLTITMPLTANLFDGQEFKIRFGGTITSGYVVNNLTLTGNSGQSILAGSQITSAISGDGFSIKWDSTTTKWNIY